MQAIHIKPTNSILHAAANNIYQVLKQHKKKFFNIFTAR